MSDKPRRHSLRLPDYDYSQAGGYFVTICCQDRLRLLGEVVDGEVVLTEAGEMVRRIWDELAEAYPGVQLDASVIMPNHMHGVVLLNLDAPSSVGAGPRARPNGGTANVSDASVGAGPHAGPNACDMIAPKDAVGAGPRAGPERVLSLSDLMQRFKSLTTSEYIRGVKERGWPPFPGKLWQRGFYEHVIRNEDDLADIREYIVNNPAKWADDVENA